MIYEVAKKLKDAGFPQDKCSYGYFSYDESYEPFLRTKAEMENPGDAYVEIPNHLHNDDFKLRASVPTLSELIEACGDKIASISKAFKAELKNGKKLVYVGWVARSFRNKKGLLEEFGSTPEEAVANLWLELKKTWSQ